MVETEVAALPEATGEAGVDLTALEAGEAALSLNRDARQRVQLALTLLGHNTRGTDGSFGKNTRKAIGEYQVASALGATGYLDQATYQRLMSDAAIPLQQWEMQEAARLAAEKEAAEKAAAEAASAAPAPAPAPAVEEPAPTETQTAAVSPSAEPAWAGTWYGEKTVRDAYGNGAEVPAKIELTNGVGRVVLENSATNISLDSAGNLNTKVTLMVWAGRQVIVKIEGTFPNFTIRTKNSNAVTLTLSPR